MSRPLMFILILFLLFIGIKHAHSHDIYTNWQRPGGKGSCCSERDCYPTKAKFDGEFWWAVRRADNKWIKVPNDVIIKEEPGDQQAHICEPGPVGYFPDPQVWCFVPPKTGI